MTEEELIQPAEKKRPGRPKKTAVETADVFVPLDESETGEEKPKRSTRPKKITGKDVETVISHGFTLVAILTGQGHWIVPADEIKPWSADAADILNRIPSKYIKGAAMASGYVSVGFGLYSVVAPRMAETQRIANERREKEDIAKSAAKTEAAMKENLGLF